MHTSNETALWVGEGHLPKRADKIARKHGAWLVNYTDPNGRKSYWFAAPNLGSPHDDNRRRDLSAALIAAKIIEERGN